MSARPQPFLERPTRLRSATGRLAVAGAAGLAAMVAIAPAASALDDVDPIAPEVAPESPAPEVTLTPEAEIAEQVAPAAEEAPTAAPALEPNFGYQKYRVGVKLADGSYVPEGTTTAGTVFTITETNRDGDTYTFTCTTSAETTTEDGTTFCLEDEADYPEPPEEPGEEFAEGPVAQAVVEPDVEVDPEDSDDAGAQLFQLGPGVTVSVALTATPPNLRGVTTPAGVGTCLGPNLTVECVNSTGGNQVSAITFSLVGLPPVAVDDSARTRVNVPVDIAILPNDDTVLGAPLTGLVLASTPSNGTATLVGNIATYTPARDFTGNDSFTYTLSTPNGTATATVRVIVEGGVVQAVLPNTGGPDAALLGFAALLLGGGAWLTARSRRDRLGAHVEV